MRISDWSSDVCSSDLRAKWGPLARGALRAGEWLALSFADRVIAVSPSLAAQLRQSFPQRAHSIAYIPNRSEEHTSELQSLMRISYAVFCLKKKKIPL